MKGKVSQLQARLWPRGSSMTMALEGVEWSAARPGCNLPPCWAPGLDWMGGESRPTGIRSPDRPTCSQSLY